MKRISLVLLLLAACTRADPVERDKAEPAASRPAPVKKSSVSVDPVPLSHFGPAADKLFVLLRIDRLAALQLDRSADAIMAPLPDYQRVFGGAKTTLGDHFDLVMVSTADATVLTASTLAARTAKGSPPLRPMLAYADSGVTWHEYQDHHYATFAENQRFGYFDPRVYFVPQERWMVMTKPGELGSLLPDPDSPEDVKPSAWLGRLPEAPTLGTKRNLLAAFEARNLTESLAIPTLGSLRLPRDMGVTLDGTAADDLVLSGWMRFAEEADARTFEGAGAALQEMGKVESFAETLKPYGALRPLQTLEIERNGLELHWRAKVTVADVQAMSRYSAGLAAQWMMPMPTSTGWDAVAPATGVP